MRVSRINRTSVLPAAVAGLLPAAVVLATLLLAPMSASGAQILGLYTFEGVSPGAFDDVSGQGLDPNNVGTGALDASGYEGQAASFSGTHTPIEIPVDIDPNSNPTLTVGAWVKTDTIGRYGVFGQDDGGWDRGLVVGGNSGNNWRYPGGTDHDSGIGVTIDTWQFVAVAYNGTESAKIYVGTNNSHIVGTMSWTNSLTSAGGTLPAATSWQVDSIGLGVGDNVITVSGTNVLGTAAGDSVTITRRAFSSSLANARFDYANASVEGATTADFSRGEGLPDTYGTGRWNYYESDANDTNDYVDGSTFQDLVFANSVGNAGNSGFRDPENTSWTPIVSGDGRLFNDSIALSPDKIAMHPGDDADEEFVVVRWTAGAGEGGSICITGVIGRAKASGGDGRDFYVMKGNAAADSFDVLFSQALTDANGTTPVPFNTTTTIAVGEHIDFAEYRRGHHGTDELHLLAEISRVPQKGLVLIVR